MKGFSAFPKLQRTGSTPSDCLVLYQDTRWRILFSSAEMQQLYPVTPTERRDSYIYIHTNITHEGWYAIKQKHTHTLTHTYAPTFTHTYIYIYIYMSTFVCYVCVNIYIYIYNLLSEINYIFDSRWILSTQLDIPILFGLLLNSNQSGTSLETWKFTKLFA